MHRVRGLLAGGMVLSMMARGTWAQGDAGAAPTRRLVLELLGRGVQIYNCQRRPGDAPAWVLRAPEADLFAVDEGDGSAAGGDGIAKEEIAKERAAKAVGHHSAGPVWRLNDGSAVHGEMVEKREAPAPGAIPWLVLRATAPTGSGALTGVVEIRREQTQGGVAPATGCGEATVGTEWRVPYTAVYRFYGLPRAGER